MTDGEAYRTHDPRVLRAIAHPVRVRILHELNATGPSRAADLAADLDIPANQASFHLRQLAKYGLVVEAPEEARDRRDRVWKAIYASAREEESFGHLSQGALRLTRDEAAQLATELSEVTHRWSAKTRGRDPERKTYLLMEVLQLYPDLAPKSDDLPPA